MTPLSLVLSFFPALVMGMAIAAFFYVCMAPSLLSVLLLIGILYGFPLLVYHLHQWRYPVKEGISYLQGDTYSPWWGSHQIQAIYIAFPVLETLLRLIPGAFSLWLRLWGAKVGQAVYWTPLLEIADRGLLDIGDRVVFGHRVGLYAHAIKPRKNNLMLYAKTIKIGNDAFLSSGTAIGPGVELADHTFLPIESRLYPNQHAHSTPSPTSPSPSNSPTPPCAGSSPSSVSSSPQPPAASIAP